MAFDYTENKIQAHLHGIQVLCVIWPLPAISDLISSVSTTWGPLPGPGTYPVLRGLALAVPSPLDAPLPAWPAPGHLQSPPHKDSLW